MNAGSNHTRPSSFKDTKCFFPAHSWLFNIVGKREVACSALYRQGSNFESYVCRAVSFIHLTILRRLFWPSLACMCTDVSQNPTHFISCGSLEIIIWYFERSGALPLCPVNRWSQTTKNCLLEKEKRRIVADVCLCCTSLWCRPTYMACILGLYMYVVTALSLHWTNISKMCFRLTNLAFQSNCQQWIISIGHRAFSQNLNYIFVIHAEQASHVLQIKVFTAALGAGCIKTAGNQIMTFMKKHKQSISKIVDCGLTINQHWWSVLCRIHPM